MNAAAPASGDARADAVRRAARLRLIAFDVDGTLTAGGICIGASAEASKTFCVRDGFGLTLLREAGIEVVIVTGRRSDIVEVRSRELKIATVLQGVADKGIALRELCGTRGLALDAAAFMGDDWPDLRAMRLAGLAAAPADAVPEVRAAAHWVATAAAGSGAARELAEFVLRAQGRFEQMLERYAAR